MDIRDHEKFMALALIQARAAFDAGEVPVGAVIARGDDIVAVGKNQRETFNDPTAHAEIMALRAAAEKTGAWKLDGCRMYVTLEPCPMCAGAIAMARLDAVYYGAFDPAMGCAGSVYELCGDRRFGKGTAIAGGLLERECSALLSDFFAIKRGKKQC